jgi:hypothetical protein
MQGGDMPVRSYKKRGLVVKRGGAGAAETQVRDLQRDLRALGYLKKGVDGQFGSGTELAVKALQHDLLHNDGGSTTTDGDAPVRVLDFNKGRVVDITGLVDPALADCVSDMLEEPKYPKLPKTADPKEENKKIVELMKDMRSREVPIPFIMAILKQESRLKHYHEPRGKDEDTFIVVGLDTNASQKYIITSRGYGAGQYTLFHHPPTQEEVEDFMLDVEKNLQKAMWELRYKFDYFVNGRTTGTRADDRIAEFGKQALRLCKYNENDPRYMTDCQICMREAGRHNIRNGVTRFYRGSKHVFEPTQYYKSADYDAVPVRKNIPCDWPYAARRYNGSGINSYHYQTIILRNVLSL